MPVELLELEHYRLVLIRRRRAGRESDGEAEKSGSVSRRSVERAERCLCGAGPDTRDPPGSGRT